MQVEVIAKGMTIPNKTYRLALLKMEKAMRQHPGFQHKDSYNLKHEFAKGMYIRRLLVPKGHMIMSFVHKDSYPLFLMTGDWTEITPNGNIRMQAPQSFITKAGAQKMGFAHSDTVWATVHLNPDNGQDIDTIEERIFDLHYDKLVTMEDDELELIKELNDMSHQITHEEALCLESH